MAYDNNIYARIITGELTTEEVDQLKASGEWDEIQKILDLTADFQLPHRDVAANYKKLADRKQHIQKPKARVISLKRVLRVAAMLVVVLGAGFLFMTKSSSHTAQHGSQLSLVLPDESTVILNAGSNITYGRSFDKHRKLVLKGEALFEVETGMSFTVETNKGQVTVLGTKFNVNTWGSELKVECYEGKVEVESEGQKVVLSKGETVGPSRSAQLAAIDIAHDSPYWLSGQSRFVDRPLEEVLEELQRQFDVVIQSQATPRTFAGVFDHKSLEEALQQVCIPLGLKYEIEANGKVTIVDE